MIDNTTERTFTCNTCGTSGSVRWMDQHPCGEIENIASFGGRCEDYPCCGHAPNECEPRESFTKDYWAARLDAMSPEEQEDWYVYGDMD